jgi:hypothetical protein
MPHQTWIFSNENVDSVSPSTKLDGPGKFLKTVKEVVRLLLLKCFNRGKAIG